MDAERKYPLEDVWWKKGVIYQVYPRSFMDDSGDGVGDLPGITSRLEYLPWLGVDAVWISPIYASPMVDFGYDVTDHQSIHPLFGNLEDFDGLIEEAHRLGLKVVLDYVPNHTSDEHPWFVESRSSRENPKRDWYIWRDPAPENPGGLPNNWLSVFGGPAWTFDKETGQYNYHAYLKEQPDLNWGNPDVREAMLDVMRFWLDRGVDGFRLDGLRHLVKDEKLRDNPPNPRRRPSSPPYDALLPTYSADRPEIHDLISKIRKVLEEDSSTWVSGERAMVGELYLPIERLVRYYGENGKGVHLPSNMHLISTPWDAREIAELVEEYEAALPEGAWPNWVLGNHDRSRIATRLGAGQARVAAMLLLTLRGTPTLYYGDEIGMADGFVPAEKVQDPFEKNVPGIGVGRDPERTPMQWNNAPNAGFCPEGVEPWLPVPSDHTTVNVTTESEDPGSLLTLYRFLLDLRRRERALSIGSYQRVFVGGDLFAYRREHEDCDFLIVLNLGSGHQTLDLAESGLSGRISLSTHPGREEEVIQGEIALHPNEGIVAKLSYLSERRR